MHAELTQNTHFKTLRNSKSLLKKHFHQSTVKEQIQMSDALSMAQSNATFSHFLI